MITRSTTPRILYLTPGCFDKGGISRYSRYQISALRENYGEESVYCLSLLGPDADSFETDFRVDWHAGGASRIAKAAFTVSAARAVVRFRPTHVHAAHVNFSPLSRSLARIAGAKTLLNIYGLEIWSNLKPTRRHALGAIETVVADCHFTAEYALEHRLRMTKPEVIWDCVDLTRFSPGSCPESVLAKYGIPAKDRHFVVLTLGRISRAAAHKGYDRLLRSFAAIAATCPEARLVLAGNGDAIDDYRSLATHLGIANRTCFTGSVDEADLPDVYRAASVFSLVSDRGVGRGEGIPLTPLEALACGIPVIVGDQDGSQEAVIGDNGFVCAPFDMERHSDLMMQFYRSATRVFAMGRSARRVATQYFGYERFKRQHAKLYSDIAEEDADHAAYCNKV